MPPVVRYVVLSVLAVGACVFAFGPAPVQEAAAPPAMDEAGRAFLGLLSDDQRGRAHRRFDDEERYDWHFIPRRRNGLPLGAMTGAQREAAHTLLRSGLSNGGYDKATGVVDLEEILGILEGNPSYRDPAKYYVTVFGEPAGDTPWGWRFEGHHLSLNYASIDSSRITSTPAFFGANPARVPRGDRRGMRLLGAEEDRARRLLGLLNPDQRALAIVGARAPRDIITGADRHARLEAYEGLPASSMTSDQRSALLDLVREYTHNAAGDIAEASWRRMEEAGVENLHFAWAGGTEPRQGHYYRVHGPTILIEYDNTQDGANHAHTVLRAFGHDFGDDLLRRHYDEAH